MSATLERSTVAPLDVLPGPGRLGWWGRCGLQLRMQILIQGCLIVVLLAGQQWISQRFEREILAGAEKRVVAVADGAINGLNTLMDTKVGSQDVVSDATARALFIRRMGISEGIRDLRIVRGKGTVDEYGEGLPQEQPVDDMDRAVLGSGKPQFRLLRHGGGEAQLRGVLPFIALKEFRANNCLGCHAVAEGSVLGVASVTVDIADALADIRQINTRLWVGQAGLQIVLFFVIGFIVRGLLGLLGGEPSYAVGIAGRIASGDLAGPIDTRPGDRDSLLAALRTMRDSLARIVGEVRCGTDTIAAASGQIANGNLNLSSRTEQQASSLQQTAASMEELTSTVKQNADHARQASALALSASNVAVQGGVAVSQVVETMSSIEASSSRIVDIIGVIDGIAFQTNILALNAAVEAARAGEQGRGFAVVAAEVRSLAQRSAAAAGEIKALIGDSVEQVQAGTRLVDRAGATMNEIVGSIKQVAAIMGQIAAASQEQTSGIEQVNEAVNHMDRVTQQNATQVEEAAAAAESLHEEAQRLSQLVRVFKLDADGRRLELAS